MLPPATDTGCNGRIFTAAVSIPAGGMTAPGVNATGGVGVGVRDRAADAFVATCGFGVDGRLLDWLFVWPGCGVAGVGDGVVGGAARGDSGNCCESSSIEPAPWAWL